MITIAKAESPEDLDAVRDLVRTYVRWATATISPSDNTGVFDNLEEELGGLPGHFGPPGGYLILARLNGEPAGCVGFFDRGNAAMEIKRMFVDPNARGHGIGGRMLDLLLAEALKMGHRRCLLWSHHSMHASHAVYARAGFQTVPFSDDFPGAIEDVEICMEMNFEGKAFK
jgi:GNAT superfamily N-acetyltransferase